MTTVLIDTSTDDAKRLVDFLKTIKYVKIIEKDQDNKTEYDEDFVAMIREREKQPTVKLDLDNLWK